MRTFWKGLAVLAGLATTTSQATAAEFAPPLDRTLQYAVTQERTNKGQSQKFSSTDSLLFTKAGDGYHLRWQSGPVDVEAPKPLDDVLREVMKIAAAQPVTLILGPTGEMIGVVDLPAWRAQRSAMLDSLLKPVAALPVGAFGPRIIQSLKDTQARQTDDQVVQELTEAPSYVTIAAVIPMEAGEEFSADVELPLYIGSGTIKAKTTVQRIEDDEAGHGRLVISSTPDPAELKQAVKSVLATLLEDAPIQVRTAALKQIDGARLSLQERLEVVYDQATGLAVSAVSTKTTSLGEAADRLERTELRMLR